MTTIRNILTSTTLYLAAGACVSCSHAAADMSAPERAEQQIRLQWQNNPKLSYHTLSCKGTLQECSESIHFVQEVRTVQGTWIPIQELPPETLVFKGERKGFKPGKTTGGCGYFFCSPNTGNLVAYVLTK